MRYLLLLLALIACEAEPVHNNEIVNTWWCLNQDATAIYLGKEDQERYFIYTWWDINPELDWDLEGDGWRRLNEHKIELTHWSNVYSINLKSQDGCYKVSMGLFSDEACTCESMGYPILEE